MFRAGKLLVGRQMTHLICHILRLNERMNMIYTIADLCGLKWQGDGYDKASFLRDKSNRVLDRMRTEMDSISLRDLLVVQMEQSQGLQPDAATYYREDDKRTYEYLMKCIDRYLS